MEQNQKRLSEKGNKKHKTKKENREERIEKKELSMFFFFFFFLSFFIFFFTLFVQKKIYNPQFATLRPPSQQIANCITTILINENLRQGLILSKGKLLL